MVNDSTPRRKFIQSIGVGSLLGLSGCSQFLEESDDVKDTDGDGVIDSEDYAPRDSSVQSADQVNEHTESTTPTEEPTTTESTTTTEEATTTEEPTTTEEATTTEESTTTEEATTTEKQTTTQTQTATDSTYSASDLDWSVNTTGDATAQVSREPLTYEVYKCEEATSRTAVGSTQSVSISFDYTVTAEQWWEVPVLEVYSDGELVFKSSAGEDTSDERLFEAESYGSETGKINQEIETGGETEVVLGLVPSDHCSASDHASTSLEISKLEVTTDSST